MLFQVVNGQERVKHQARPNEYMYAMYRELLAVVEMIKHFRHYLWGRHFMLGTDHASLVWLKNYRDADSMFERYLVKLEEYNFKTVHRDGKAHGIADGLSGCHSCNNQRCAKRPLLVTSDSEAVPFI